MKGKEIFGNKEDICEPSFKINNLVLIFGGSYLTKDMETGTSRVNHGAGVLVWVFGKVPDPVSVTCP